MNVLVDTNILLDVAFARHRLCESSDEILRYCQAGTMTGYLAWHTLSNVFYILSAENPLHSVRAFIADLLDYAEVAAINSDSAKTALRLPMKDFEDAMQVSAAMACSAQYLITRNVRDFTGSPIRIVTPEEFLSLVAGG